MNLIGNHFTISQLFVLKQDLAAVVVERDMQSTLEKPWREKNYNFIVWCKYSSLAGTIGIWNSVSFFLTPEVLPSIHFRNWVGWNPWFSNSRGPIYWTQMWQKMSLLIMREGGTSSSPEKHQNSLSISWFPNKQSFSSEPSWQSCLQKIIINIILVKSVRLQKSLHPAE